MACLRQGLRLARDHRLTDLGWLTDAAHVYTDDSIWEPLAPAGTRAGGDGGQDATASGAGGDGTGLETPADALAELLTAIDRRQHEHRARTAERITAVLDTGLLDGELTALALYYRAKAHKDLGRTGASRDGMRQVADAGGRLAPKARRGLANLDRISGDFPTALAAVPTLGWKGRHHRVAGDIHWPHANLDQAIAAFEAARAEAEQHDAAGERAIIQIRLALATAFADPVRADDELDLAHQLLAPLDQRATTLLAHIAALVKDAGDTGSDVPGRSHRLRREVTDAGLPWADRIPGDRPHLPPRRPRRTPEPRRPHRPAPHPHHERRLRLLHRHRRRHGQPPPPAPPHRPLARRPRTCTRPPAHSRHRPPHPHEPFALTPDRFTRSSRLWQAHSRAKKRISVRRGPCP
ncbi:hypothetical protein AAFN69_29655 [Streptomyces sp. CAU 1734]